MDISNILSVSYSFPTSSSAQPNLVFLSPSKSHLISSHYLRIDLMLCSSSFKKKKKNIPTNFPSSSLLNNPLSSVNASNVFMGMGPFIYTHRPGSRQRQKLIKTMRRVSVSSLCYVGHLYQLPSLTAQSWGTSQRGGREEHEKRGGRKNVSNLEKKGV